MKLKEDAIFEELEDEGYLYDSGNDKLFSLNETGRLIVRLIQDNKNVPEIKDKIIEEFKVDESTANKDLNEFLDVLKTQGFLDGQA